MVAAVAVFPALITVVVGKVKSAVLAVAVAAVPLAMPPLVLALRVKETMAELATTALTMLVAVAVLAVPVVMVQALQVVLAVPHRLTATPEPQFPILAAAVAVVQLRAVLLEQMLVMAAATQADQMQLRIVEAAVEVQEPPTPEQVATEAQAE